MYTQISVFDNDNSNRNRHNTRTLGCIHSAIAIHDTNGQGHHTQQSRQGRRSNNWAIPQLFSMNVMSKHQVGLGGGGGGEEKEQEEKEEQEQEQETKQQVRFGE